VGVQWDSTWNLKESIYIIHLWGEVLYNILIQFGLLMELFRFIIMYLNKRYSKVHICTHSCNNIVLYHPVTQHLLLNVTILYVTNKQKTNSLALSPRANYTDWATATCRRNLVPTFVDRGVSRGQRSGSPMVINLSFLDRILYITLFLNFKLFSTTCFWLYGHHQH
jgi:hypothetical protein